MHHYLFIVVGALAGITNSSAFIPSHPSYNRIRQQPSTKLSAFKFEYTHTEVNGMLWKVPDADLSLVIDPIATDLTFGLPPWVFRGEKNISEQDTLGMIVNSKPSHCLISQSLDDHCHLATLTKLLERIPKLKFIVAPSALEKLETIVQDKDAITVLSPGESIQLPTANGVDCRLSAVEGSLTGPPWTARQNGYLLTTTSKQGDSRSVFYEPHADITDQTLDTFKADIVISPVKTQDLLGYRIIYGPDRTLNVIDKLGAQVWIVLRNGELKSEGVLDTLIQSSGSVEEAVRMNTNKDLRLENPESGQTLTVQL